MRNKLLAEHISSHFNLYMKKTIFYVLGTFWLCITSGFAVTVDSPDASIPKHYVPPIIGNGSICTSIDYCGEQAQKKIRTYYPEVVWAGRRYSRTDNSAALITMGHYETLITIGGKPLGKLLSWSQTLDRRGAVVETSAKYERATVRTSAFVPMGCDMLAVKKIVEPASGATGDIQIKFTYFLTDTDSKKNPPRMFVEPAVAAQSPERATIEYVAYGLKVYRGEVQIFPSIPSKFESGKNSASFTSDFKNSPAQVSYLIAYADNYNEDIAGDVEKIAKKIVKGEKKPSYADVQKIVNIFKADEFPEAAKLKRSEALRAIAAKGYDAVFADHQKKWDAYYTQGSQVSIPDKKVAEAYLTGLYHMKTVATKWSFPVTMFGHGAGWSGRYFGWDEFYTSVGAMSAGKFDLSQKAPIFRRKLLAQAVMRVSYYRAPTFNKVGARYVWETNEDGTEGTTDGLWLDHVFHMSTISATGWKQYLYTGDKEFLEETAYPVMKECALFLLSHMVYKNADKITIGKCTDIERLGPAVENAFLTSCGAIYSFETAAKAAEILGVDSKLANEFRQTAAGLRKSLPKDDKMYLPFDGCKEKSIVTIGGYFPFQVIASDDKKGVAAVDDFMANIYTAGNMVPVGNSVCSWYASWLSSAYACIGNPDKAFATAMLSTVGVGLFSEPWEILETGNNPWFVSAAGNLIYAFNNLMLHQDEDGQMRVAWGLPESWTDYSFTLPSYGGGKVSAEVKNGKFAKLEYAANGNPQKTILLPRRLVPNDKIKPEWKSDGQYYTVKLTGDFSL